MIKSPIALVTHATEFVGPAAVSALIDAGFHVVAQVTDASRLSEPLDARSDKLALTTLYAPHQLKQWLLDAFGRLDVLVSNDAFPAIHCPIAQGDIAGLQATLDALVVYPYTLMQAFATLFKQQGTGNIIMVTSCRTDLPQAGGAIPDAARAAANALMTSLSIELAPWKIPVNAIAPNFYYSEAYFPKRIYQDDETGREFIRRQVPAGRLGTVDEMKDLIRYLASLRGHFHTGSIIKFAGGWPFSEARLH